MNSVFQHSQYPGWLQGSLLLAETKHRRACQGNVVVGLRLSDRRDGQSDHTGWQQHLEQQPHSSGKHGNGLRSTSTKVSTFGQIWKCRLLLKDSMIQRNRSGRSRYLGHYFNFVIKVGLELDMINSAFGFSILFSWSFQNFGSTSVCRIFFVGGWTASSCVTIPLETHYPLEIYKNSLVPLLGWHCPNTYHFSSAMHLTGFWVALWKPTVWNAFSDILEIWESSNRSVADLKWLFSQICSLIKHLYL